MGSYTKIVLRKGKDAAVRRFHPWVFSGAIQKITGSPEEGDIAEIFSASDEYLATGHYLGGSIAVKIFSFEQREIGISFWEEKIRAAYELRTAAGLTNSPLTNAYRLVFTEGDGLPGLIIDWYNGIAVIQSHSPGMYRIRQDLASVLKEIYGEKLKGVYDKSSETVKPGDPEERIRNGYLLGEATPGTILETGHTFKVDWEAGQKTGFFLDQRSNRMFAQFYARDKKVLNAFCYTGAFTVYALKGGAKTVHSVDSSRPAMQNLEENLALNGIEKDRNISVHADVKDFLTGNNDNFDMIILDPPAFAKHHNVTHSALQAYKFINAEALKRIGSGGILMTFSCSQAISREMFRSAVHSAALESGREVRILNQLSQGPDHPVSIYHPEGEYLKGLVLLVV
jgi:23S rRNA (cytosine1962-C5)-methyltransferase